MIRGLTIFESEYSGHVKGHVDYAVFHLDVLGAEDVRLADAALEPADKAVKGIVPDPTNLPKGCPFADRCDRCMDKCREAMPKLVENEKGRAVRCFLENDAAEEE